MMDRKYIHELHPEDHGFSRKDYDKIFIGSYMDSGHASINEILTNLRKVYCGSIGVEYSIFQILKVEGIDEKKKN